MSRLNSSDDFDVEALEEHLRNVSSDMDTHDVQTICSSIEREINVMPKEYWRNWLED
jgi:hypothetical protein